jgi:hypothetical protein
VPGQSGRVVCVCFGPQHGNGVLGVAKDPSLPVLKYLRIWIPMRSSTVRPAAQRRLRKLWARAPTGWNFCPYCTATTDARKKIRLQKERDRRELAAAPPNVAEFKKL